MEKHPLHIKNPELQTSAEVANSVRRAETDAKRNNEKLRADGKAGPLQRERIPNDPAERINVRMREFESIFLNPDPVARKQNIERRRGKIHNALIIKREHFPESYFELQNRILRERGQAVEEIPANVREQMKSVAIEDQKHSLDAWIDYLASDDAVYPAWFKYFVWKNVTKLSQFDKERGEFKKRTESTVAPFPDIYREPLAQIADIYEMVQRDNKSLKEADIRDAFSKKFPALYAELIQRSLAASLEGREQTAGKWVKYGKGERGAGDRLYASLEGKRTGWCTAGRSTAQTQISSGDFYVYYTNDASGTPTQPRLAIRMDGTDRIGEVRGILPHQGVEPVMQAVLDTKLGEFGSEADVYRKKSEDMRQLTALERKREEGKAFTKDDLMFLYEINAPIESFGYNKDPRIAELRSGRNVQEDMLVVFECRRDQIARSISAITADTKAYVGKLEPGIFEKLPDGVEYVYTSFPEGRIRREHVEIGGKTAGELERLLEKSGFKIGDYARFMMKSREFTTQKNPEQIKLIRLTVRDLGFADYATTDQLFARANTLGLELCPAEAAVHYRLGYANQPMGEWVPFAMKPITGRDGGPSVFAVGRRDDGSWLSGRFAHPGEEWDAGGAFVFRLRKKTE